MNTNNPSRIELIDALRGYALMGLFLVHMVEYYEVFWYSPPAVFHPITKWMFNLFGGKAYAMFGMLFGVSFYIIMQRNAARGVDFRWRFLWRLVLLLMIGYLHGLLYCGEVLQILAVAGLLLIPLWFAPGWLLLTISIALIQQVTTFGFVGWIQAHPDLYQRPFFVAIQKVVYPVYAHGSFSEVIAANSVGGTEVKWLFMLESGRFANIVGLSLLGFWLAKKEFFTNTERYGKLYLRLLIGFVVLAFACDRLTPAFAALVQEPRIHNVWSEIIEMYFNTFVMFSTVLLLMLLYRHQPFQKILGLLAAPGRMTLSFYVGQSLLMVPFFYNFGFGAYRWIGAWQNLLLGVSLWIIQVALARWWLKRFHYGPLEWCWRAATFGTTNISMRKVR